MRVSSTARTIAETSDASSAWYHGCFSRAGCLSAWITISYGTRDESFNTHSWRGLRACTYGFTSWWIYLRSCMRKSVYDVLNLNLILTWSVESGVVEKMDIKLGISWGRGVVVSMRWNIWPWAVTVGYIVYTPAVLVALRLEKSHVYNIVVSCNVPTNLGLNRIHSCQKRF